MRRATKASTCARRGVDTEQQKLENAAEGDHSQDCAGMMVVRLHMLSAIRLGSFSICLFMAMTGVYEHDASAAHLADSELLRLLLSPADILTSPQPMPTESNDSSNDEDQPRKKQKSTYTSRKVGVDGQ